MSGSRQIMADWTDERVTKLKKLARGGLSASQISRELGFCSRNAVIGKLRRLGEALGIGRGAKAAAPKPERVKKVFAPAKRRGRPQVVRAALLAPEPPRTHYSGRSARRLAPAAHRATRMPMSLADRPR